MLPEDPLEAKFTKSARNQGTQNSGLSLLLRDKRFQTVDLETKRRIVELIGVSESFGIQTFDAVMTAAPVPPLNTTSIDDAFPSLRLVEMKTTKKPIANESLNGFFFGATEREYKMASALGDKYVFAFVVLNETNDYGAPFAVLLTLTEVEARTRSKRIQFQVNFRTDTAAAVQSSGLIIDVGTQPERITYENSPGNSAS
jgi:hypothetical protein